MLFSACHHVLVRNIKYVPINCDDESLCVDCGPPFPITVGRQMNECLCNLITLREAVYCNTPNICAFSSSSACNNVMLVSLQRTNRRRRQTHFGNPKATEVYITKHILVVKITVLCLQIIIEKNKEKLQCGRNAQLTFNGVLCFLWARY